MLSALSIFLMISWYTENKAINPQINLRIITHRMQTCMSNRSYATVSSTDWSICYHNYMNIAYINSAPLAANRCHSGFMRLCTSFAINTAYLWLWSINKNAAQSTWCVYVSDKVCLFWQNQEMIIITRHPGSYNTTQLGILGHVLYWVVLVQKSSEVPKPITFT